MDEKDNILTEQIKKSELTAADLLDYKLLELEQPCFIPCTIKEEREELIVSYHMDGIKEWKQLKEEELKDQYQCLINFPKLKQVYKKYKIKADMDNVYYDDNYIPAIKARDIYSKDEKYSEDTYLFQYKCFVGGTLHKRYDVKKIQDCGLEILKKDKFLSQICNCHNDEEIAKLLKEKKSSIISYKSENEIHVNRSGYTLRKIASRLAIVLLIAAVSYTGYHTFITEPKKESLITASQAYVNKDYVKCIDSLEKLDTTQMDKNTKYMLAVSYTQGETFKKEEIQSILAKLSSTSDERVLDYWILVGRLEMDKAQDLAISLADDKLLIYAYMKEMSMVEADTTISGEAKKARLQQLESDISSLGDKYESVEETDMAISDETQQQETKEETDLE